MQIVSRIAPTPSGYLHLGNALNFVLTWAMVRQAGGQLWLRIDDMDGPRCRPEYVDDIFWALQWLGLDYDKGPKDATDFYANYSQLKKIDFYRSKLKKLAHLSYACECSRQDIRLLAHSALYPGTCFSKKLKYDVQKHALRLHVDDEGLRKLYGDFILWRKFDLPSYHLVSLIEDHVMGVNLLVRGNDLRESSLLQQYLAKKLKYTHFLQAKFIHHKMIFTSAGEKLSKSNAALSLQAMAQAGTLPKDIFQRLAGSLGLEFVTDIETAQDFLRAYKARSFS